MKKMNIRFIAESAILAALYVALTWLLAPISYGAVQFRISEALILFVVLNPKYAYAFIIGCFVANTTSPIGWYDMVFGTLATGVALLPMLKVKRLEIASLFPVISNAFIVSIELGFAFDMFTPTAFWFNVLTIALGEAVVLYCVGIPMMLALSKNETMVDLLQLDTSHLSKKSLLTLESCLSIVLGALGIIFYVAYPFLERVVIENAEETIQTFSALKLTSNSPWLISFVIISGGSMLWGIFTKRKVKLIGNILIWIGFLICYLMVGINFNEATIYPYYYGYILYLILFAASSGYIYYLEDVKKLKKEEK